MPDTMMLYASNDNLSDVGKYILLDIKYPEIRGLSIHDLTRFRDDEGLLFQRFNHAIRKLITNFKNENGRIEDAARQVFEEVHDQVNSLKIQCTNIEKKSRIVRFQWLQFGICAISLLTGAFDTSIEKFVNPDVLKSARLVSALVGAGSAKDIINSYHSKKSSHIELRHSPYFWPFMIQQEGEK